MGTMASQALALAKRYAASMARRTGTDPDEVESDAGLGAAKAVAAWDPERYPEFGPLAMMCIKRQVSSGFRSRAGRYRRDRKAYRLEAGREIYSLGGREDYDETWTSFERWRGHEPPETVDWNLIDEVWGLVAKLPHEQRLALRFVYFFGWYDREVGAYFERSETWAWHTRRAGLARIKAHYCGEEL
jgi:DNA-directed RNA polymerase specialized sigma24 family protein